MSQTQKIGSGKNNIFKLTVLAMFSAVAVVLVLLIHFPIIPAAPVLEYDMADIPVLMATFMFGPFSGLAVLLVVSLVQAFMLAGNGIIGFIMHFVSSGAMVVVAGVVYKYLKRKNNALGLSVSLICAVVTATVIMIPMNLLMMPLFMGGTVRKVVEMIVPILIPFNLIKFSINCAAGGLLWMPVKRMYERILLRRQNAQK